MKNVSDTRMGGSLSIMLRCVGLKAEAVVYKRVRKISHQSSKNSAIEDQGEIIEGEIVEDVLPADIEGLDKI